MKPEISLIPAREPAVPEDRKGFTPKQRADAFLRAGGKCEVCGVKIFGGAFQVDHIIARNHLGSRNRWQEILEVNPGLNPKRLRPGQRINLPAR